jgi:hypothetical protein
MILQLRITAWAQVPTLQKQAVSKIAAMRLKYVVSKKAPNKTRFPARLVDIPESHLGVAQKIGENSGLITFCQLREVLYVRSRERGHKKRTAGVP